MSVLYLKPIVSFFFQAEDGIRALVRSRGLGDVYKRQILPLPISAEKMFSEQCKQVPAKFVFEDYLHSCISVSYTHLTLPTIYSV